MATKKSRTRHARGSALATVILVVLVLTIVGIGIAYFTQIEDRLTGNARMQKAAFYAADAGLRKGESVMGLASGSVSLTSLLAPATATAPLQVPGGGFSAVILKATDPETGALAHEFLNEVIPLASAVVDKAQYSLYLRNNAEDYAGGATTDTDNIINLVSVGQVILPGGAGAIMTTVLEEQLIISAVGSPVGGMKGLNPGGTGSVMLAGQ